MAWIVRINAYQETENTVVKLKVGTTPQDEKFAEYREVDFNFNSFRHTHATMLLENGAKPKEIQSRLGHSRLATTMDTYAHVTQKMKKETVDIFEQMLKKINFNPPPSHIGKNVGRMWENEKEKV